MYRSVFLNCSGSNILTTLGSLDRLKHQTENIIIWNVCGNASLILFFKLLGLTAKQTFDKLKNLEIINSLINGHSLFPEDDEEKKEYILDYLKKQFKNNILKEDTTLEEVKNITNIQSSFIVWNRTKEIIENLNYKDNPHFKLIDCIMATLTNIGVFKTYDIFENSYSSLETIECFPVSYSFFLNIEELLYLVNITTFIKEYSSGNNLGPLKEIEDEFLLQKTEYLKFRVKNTCKALPHNENICKLFSIFSRGNSTEEEKISLYNLGQKQASSFLKKEDTYIAYKNYLETVFSQK